MKNTKANNLPNKRPKIIALIIAGSAVIWLLAQWIGYQLRLPGHYAILFDILLMAALLWALLNCILILRKNFADKE